MSTTTTTATTTPTATITSITQSWFKVHERLIIVAMVLLAGTLGYGKYETGNAARATTRATVAEQALVAQKTQDAQNAATTAQVLAQYQTMVQTLATQNASLATAAASRQAAVVVQQKADSTLPLTDLAKRLKTLGNAPEASISVLGDKIELTQPGAVAVTQTLETIPVLQADLKDTQTLLGATQAAKAQGDRVIDAQTTQITGLNLAAVDQDKACKAEVTAAKAVGRKNGAKWFFRGLVTGFIGGLLVH